MQRYKNNLLIYIFAGNLIVINNIITITSDWAKSDYYLSSLKGRLLSLDYSATIVDISNNIPSLDVMQSIFILKSSYRNFPRGTIHLMCVASEPNQENPMVITQYDGYYFVGINDGRFVHLFDEMPSVAYSLKLQIPFSTFMALELFVEAVRIIAQDSFMRDTSTCDLKREVMFRPVCTATSIIGKVIYIDSFGNAIINITKKLFDSMLAGREFEILVQGPYAIIPTISRSYSCVPPGDKVALFNSLGYLEIAVNQGNIAESEGLVVSSEITIRFI